MRSLDQSMLPSNLRPADGAKDLTLQWQRDPSHVRGFSAQRQKGWTRVWKIDRGQCNSRRSAISDLEVVHLSVRTAESCSAADKTDARLEETVVGRFPSKKLALEALMKVKTGRTNPSH